MVCEISGLILIAKIPLLNGVRKKQGIQSIAVSGDFLSASDSLLAKFHLRAFACRLSDCRTFHGKATPG